MYVDIQREMSRPSILFRPLTQTTVSNRNWFCPTAKAAFVFFARNIVKWINERFNTILITKNRG